VSTSFRDSQGYRVDVNKINNHILPLHMNIGVLYLINRQYNYYYISI